MNEELEERGIGFGEIKDLERDEGRERRDCEGERWKS